VDAQYLQPGDELLTEKNEWQTVEAVIITEEPLEAYNLSVDEYETYFVSGEEGADAIWVHNNCYDNLPSGFSNTGRTTSYGQPIYRGSDGRDLYRGHDGRYYDPDAHPPSPRPDAETPVINAPDKGLDSFANAADYGIKPYNELRRRTRGTGLEAHHLIEQRFAGTLGVNPRTMGAIALTPAEHQMFTNAWRRAIPYGTGTATASRQQIMAVARDIYKDYPEILQALGL